MTGQWFIITAVVLTGIFFVISGFYATYSKTKDTDIIGSDTAYYFKNVKTAIDKLSGEDKEKALELRNSLIETVAEKNDELLEKYLEGKDLTPEEIKKTGQSLWLEKLGKV